ncbi:MAG: hypothetical protein ABSC37_05855 [Xanthobacteraceae bacterium]
MKRLKLIALIVLAVIATPLALLTLCVARLKFEEWRFYQARPILHAMWDAHLGLAGDDGRDSTAAREVLLRRFSSGSIRTTAVAALTAEGFYCQNTQLHPGAIDCQLQAPADVGYTLWIVDFYANNDGELSDAHVVIGGISF